MRPREQDGEMESRRTSRSGRPDLTSPQDADMEHLLSSSHLHSAPSPSVPSIHKPPPTKGEFQKNPEKNSG